MFQRQVMGILVLLVLGVGACAERVFDNPLVEDLDGDGIPAAVDCDDSNANLLSRSQDQDCDGVPAGFDCNDNNPDSFTRAEDGDCDD